MISNPGPADAARMRAFLTESGYDESSLQKMLGVSKPPAADEFSQMLFITRGGSAMNVLTRLFLMGADVETSAVDEYLPDWFREIGLTHGLLEKLEDRYRSAVVIVPYGEFFVVSDAFAVLGGDEAAEFVLPASTHSAKFLQQVMIPARVDDALDLGCGAGLHALHLSMQAKHVVASDISERAIAYARFNADLNGRDNIECIVSDRFAGLQDKKFDLIISNPPFVPSPGESYTYRDNAGELDEFCAALLPEAAAHLNDGGHLQMLCEWVEIHGQAWQDRVKPWIEPTECDAWILHSPPVSPGSYVRKRSADIHSPGGGVDPREFNDWVLHFKERNVTGIHPGMILLRKRSGDSWFHVQDMASDLTGNAGEAVIRGIEACDFLQRSDEELLSSKLTLSPHLVLEQKFERESDHWQPGVAVLSMSDGMVMEAEVDMPVLAFMNQLDGSKTIEDCVAQFSEAANAPAERIRSDFLTIVRMFVGRGFVRPA